MAEQPTERWQDAVTRRVRALVRTEPLHGPERSKGRRDLDLSRVDLRALALRVLDVVIEEMGLGRGASRTDIRRALAGMIVAEARAGSNTSRGSATQRFRCTRERALARSFRIRTPGARFV